MTQARLETDYLIAGCGAVGMAFVDTLLTETDADIVIVDRRGKPGGHWNDAYPFVTLHQPSAFYGVASKELSRGEKDQTGLNKGLLDLATGDEVCAYFDAVMRERFLPSGRVRYFPMSDYLGDGRFKSLTSGAETEVSVRRKFVDATFYTASVPSTHTPNFTIAPDVWFEPLNALPRLKRPPAGYVVVGGGKTGIDAVLWLLQTGVDPDAIRWIMPRDAWLLDRGHTQPGLEFFEQTMGAQAARFETMASAADLQSLFDGLEQVGYLTRIDRAVRPSMFHAATVSQRELEQLRRVKNVIRLGRVSAIEADRIILRDGEIPTSPNHLHVDCSARPLEQREHRPVFEPGRITVQMLRPYQPVFSASLIAHFETLLGDDDAKKNSLSTVMPLPDELTDFVEFSFLSLMNEYLWSQQPGLDDWKRANRLDGFSATIAAIPKDDAAKHGIMERIRKNAVPAVENLQRLMTANAGSTAAAQ